jgi:hypothetical protein
MCFGQTSLATVTGTISDTTGAVVANGKVDLRNLENGQTFSGASSDTGNFTISQLPIGDYDLTVAVSGFKTYKRSGFHLAANQTMREDVVLEVGQQTESVTVTAQASMLKTETSELSQNVTLTQLNNLPILVVGATNSGFRDPFAAVRLVPGIRYTNGSNIANGAPGPTTTMVVNGTPANTYQTRLDGMTINPTGPRLIGAQMQTQPSVDAVEEVAIMTSNFAAEFGTAGGAMITMTTKSGTNQYHGSAYDYGTNEALNARQPYTNNRNVVKQHDWGYSVGGPVWLPKIYDGRNKTFFFWSYEQYRSKQVTQSNNTSVPTAAYRTGNFAGLIAGENRMITRAQGSTTINATDALGRTMQSGTIFDPDTERIVNGVKVRDPFLNNVIPSSRFDPISVKVLALIPNPLGSNADRGVAANNYQGTFNSGRTSAIPSIKFDQNLGASNRLSFYYQDTHTQVPRTPTGADPFSDLITGSVASRSSGQTIRVNYDWTATPRLLVHIGAGWNDSDFGLTAPVRNYDAVKELGLTGQTKAAYFPAIVTGVNTTNDAIGGLTRIGAWQPSRSMERRPTGNISATYVVGSHTIKAGGEWRQEKFPNILDVNTNGTWNFGAAMTEQPSLQGVTTNGGFDGFEFASFLLGGMSSNTLNASIHLANVKYQYAMYLQDNWKVTRKLSLDYGVRWDMGTYARESFGRNASVGLAVPNPSASGRPGALQFEAACKCNFAANYPYAIGPRLGAAYQINPKTILRVGIGVVYNSTSTSSGSNASGANTSTLPANGGQITGLFKNGMPAEVQPRWPSYEPNVGQAIGAVVPFPQLLDANAGRPARLLQWNIGLQREISRDLVVEASYVGNRGTWWSVGPAIFTTNNPLSTQNVIGLDTLKALGFTNLTDLNESRLLSTTISALTSAQRSTLLARGISTLPYPNFPTSQTVRQSLIPYPQYSGGFNLNAAPLGNTWFDSFQLNTTKRFSHGIQFNLNYNYSKNLDLMSATDPFNRANGKNLSVWDLPHQLRITVDYRVPNPKTSGIPVLSNRIVAAIVSDWGIGAYLNYQSAAIIGRPASAGAVPLNQFLGYGPGSAQLKKDANGEYMNPWSVDWTDYDGKHHTDPLNINCHCFDVTKTVLLNPAVWEHVADGQFAAQQGSIRNFRAQRQPQENMNFSRNFRMGKEGRVQLNVRVEFNNIFNRMQYGAPSTTAFQTAATKFTSGANNGLYSGGFGTITPYSGTNGQRIGSFVGRLTF